MDDVRGEADDRPPQCPRRRRVGRLQERAPSPQRAGAGLVGQEALARTRRRRREHTDVVPAVPERVTEPEDEHFRAAGLGSVIVHEQDLHATRLQPDESRRGPGNRRVSAALLIATNAVVPRRRRSIAS